MVIKQFVKFISSIKSIHPSYWFASGLVFIGFFFVAYYSIDPDFGWHLRSGQIFIESGIPKTDIFTYTASNLHWINHEWLNDVLVARLYSLGGYAMLAAFFAAVWTTALVLASRKHSAAVLLLASFSLLPFAGIRPIAWTLLFVAILERIIASKNKKTVYFLPLLFMIWANLHGSFVLGLVILALWQIFSKKRLPWVPALACLPAVLVNPYGPWVFEEIFRTAVDSKLRFRINEWQMIMLPILSSIYFFVFVSFHFAFGKHPIKKIISIPGLLLAMSISSIRHFPVFVVVSLRYLEQYFSTLTKQIKWNKLSRSRVIVLSTIICLPTIVLIFFIINHIRILPSSTYEYPENAVKYLQSNGCRGNMFNSYNYGGYLIWKLPEQKVYIDGRMPSWKQGSVDYFKNYIDVYAKDEFRRSEFDKYNIQCVLVNNADRNYTIGRAVPFSEQLVREGWVLVEEASSNKYSLFVKKQ